MLQPHLGVVGGAHTTRWHARKYIKPNQVAKKHSVPKLLAQVTIAALLAIGAIVANYAVVGNDDYCKYMPRFEIQPRLKDSLD